MVKTLRQMFYDVIGTKAGWMILVIIGIGSTLLFGLSSAIGMLLGIDVVYVLMVLVMFVLIYEWITNAQDRANRE